MFLDPMLSFIYDNRTRTPWPWKGVVDLYKVVFDSHISLYFYFFNILIVWLIFHSQVPCKNALFSSIYFHKNKSKLNFIRDHVVPCMHGIRFFFDLTLDKSRDLGFAMLPNAYLHAKFQFFWSIWTHYVERPMWLEWQ